MTQATSLSNNTEFAIRIRGLEKSFGRYKIHMGVDLDIPRGQITYIMGGSGTGKSLLLKQIMGFIPSDKGSIEINGEVLDCSDKTKLKRIRKSMGILFQNGALFDSLSVYNNVAFSLHEQLNLPKSEVDARVESLLKSVGLKMEHAYKAPAELSGGQRKRVALARAIALKPSIMMFDEPTTGLDPITTHMVTELIQSVSKQNNLTSIVISHDTHVAFDVAEHLAFLQKGRIGFVGKPTDVFKVNDPETQEFFSLEKKSVLGGKREP